MDKGNPSVKEILKEWLRANGFSGLYDEHGYTCGCTIDDLAPCSADDITGCKAGYKVIITEENKADPENIISEYDLEVGDYVVCKNKPEGV